MVLSEHGLDHSWPGLLSSLFGNGNLGRAGVLCFLIVSGFIIPASIEQGGSNVRFWMRRFFRLFPTYWLSIAVAFGYCWSSGGRARGAVANWRLAPQFDNAARLLPPAARMGRVLDVATRTGDLRGRFAVLRFAFVELVEPDRRFYDGGLCRDRVGPTAADGKAL